MILLQVTTKARFTSAMLLLALALIHASALAAPPASPEVAAAVQPALDKHAIAGAVVVVASREKVLSLNAMGYADIAAKAPMPADAMFWIASMSKSMTATALMMLVEEGKVNLDESVETYLPEFKVQMLAVEQDKDHVLLKKPSHPIKVREILSHTSGLPRTSSPEAIRAHGDTMSLEAAAISYSLTPLVSEPGTKYLYSNAGINTAGRIIEVISAMPYEKFMETRLFKPLGMSDTTFWPNEEQVRRLAKNYVYNATTKGIEEKPIAQLTYPVTNRSRGVFPAGGVFSTATDVSTFCRMILSGGTLDGKRYLSEESVRQMTSNQTGTIMSKVKGAAGYGFAWSTGRAPIGKGDRTLPAPFGHGGAEGTDMTVDPQNGLVYVVMVQRPDFAKQSREMAAAFAKAIIRAKGQSAPTAP